MDVKNFNKILIKLSILYLGSIVLISLLIISISDK